MLGSPGARQQRRRRVLTEEMLSGCDEQPSETVVRDAFRYGPAARREHQAPFTDFIPQSWGAFSTFALVSVLAVAGVATAGHLASLRLGKLAPHVLNLTERGSLRSLLAMGLCFAACSACAVIAALRRHRLDDFRAAFRCWWLGCLATAGLGIHEGSTLVSGLWSLAAIRFGGNPAQEPSWWGLTFCGLFWLVMIRLGWEMREYPARCAAILASALLITLGYILPLGFIPEALAPTLDFRTVSASAVLGGLWGLSTGCMAYACAIIKAAENEIQQEKRVKLQSTPSNKKSKRSDSNYVGTSETASGAVIAGEPLRRKAEPLPTEASTSGERNVAPGKMQRVDPAQKLAPPPHSPVTKPVGQSSAKGDSQDADEEDGDDESVDGASSQRRVLTKAERKALRKEKKAVELEEKAAMRDRRR